MALIVDIRKKLGAFQLDVQFESQGGILALLGASGCGKSMTLKCIAGIETPDSGSIVLDGRVLFDAKARVNLSPQARRVGYLFQNYALFPHMTVEQNIATGVRSREGKAAKLSQYIKAFYLEGTEKHYPAQLSGGQQQRVALARILASEPEILMLDEPFSALDSYLRWQVELELSDTLAQYHKTTLFVSHSRDEVYRLVDAVCVIDHGKSEPVVPVKALFETPGTLASALLSGLKNYSAARRVDARHVEALDWGMSLECAEDVPADVAYVGIRAHYVRLGKGANGFQCTVLRVVDDVFSTIVMIQPPNGHAPLRMEMDKDAWQAHAVHDLVDVHAMPQDILLLK